MKKITEEKNIAQIKPVLNIEITNEDVDDILSSALDAISYWCWKVKVVGGIYRGEYASEQISRGGELSFFLIEPFDENETEVYELTLEKFLKGLTQYLETVSIDSIEMRNEKSSRIDCGRIDGYAADCILQYALFNEIVFG